VLEAMRTVICMPTYNERDNVPSLIEEILATTDADVMVLDDNSPDGTGQVVDLLAQDEPRVTIVHRAQKEGLGLAYVDGFRRALAGGYDLIFQMDADFSHQPRYLPKMIATLKNVDVVIGSRYVDGGGTINWGVFRRALSQGSNVYARTVLGTPYKDTTSGFVGFRRHVLEAVDFETIDSQSYAFQVELKYRAHRLGFTIVELPIVFYDRTAGASKLSRRTIGHAIMRVVELKLKGGA
jgi:dolichol-phosphate mannosyltransferase